MIEWFFYTPWAWITTYVLLAVYSVRFVIGHFMEDMGSRLDNEDFVLMSLMGAMAAVLAPLAVFVIAWQLAGKLFSYLPGNQSISKWTRWFFTLDRDARKKVLNAR